MSIEMRAVSYMEKTFLLQSHHISTGELFLHNKILYKTRTDFLFKTRFEIRFIQYHYSSKILGNVISNDAYVKYQKR